MAWKLSVLQTYSDFSRGYHYRTTLTSTVTAGDMVAVAKTNSQLYLQKGDILKLGPSSHSNNLGKSEFLRVSLVNGTSITFVDSLTYDYASGDVIEGVGHAIAEDWAVPFDADAGSFTFQGIAPKGGVAGEVQPGYLGATNVQRIKKSAGSSGSVRYRLQTRTQLLSSSIYRLVAYLKTSNDYSGYATFRVYDGVGYPAYFVLSNTLNYWVQFSGVGATSFDLNGALYLIEFRFNYDNSFTYLFIGGIYLTHALMTEGEASGVYTFPENPVSVGRSDDTKDSSSASQYLSVDTYSGSLDAMPSRTYSLSFVDADVDFVRQLEILQYWQDQGYLMLLESDISSEKPLVGFMDYKPSFSHWDMNRINVDFIFRGV